MKLKQEIVNEWISDEGEQFRLTFIDSNSYKKFDPIAQCYGLCFNEKGEIAIGRNIKVFGGKWILPGGRTEKGENPNQTLEREILEELDLVADKYVLLGAQKVECLNRKEPVIYQLRYAVKIKEIRPLTIDPDNGHIWERKFVKPKEVNKYLKWGTIVDHMVEKAVEWYKSESINSLNYMGKTVEVKVDRPLGSQHPKWGNVYPVNYGYVKNTVSGDGEELDAYILGVSKPVDIFKGICIAVIRRTEENDDKLVVVPKGMIFSDAEIRKLTDFQEKYFKSEIIRHLY